VKDLTRNTKLWGISAGVALGVAVGGGLYTFVYAKGGSYLTNNPQACANCHIMQDHYDAWIKSSHRSVATCNDCHTPPGLIPKYLTKAENGFFHSLYFTTGNFPDPLVWALFPGGGNTSRFTLYEDDGDSDAYQGGEFVTTAATLIGDPGKRASLRLTIGAAASAGALSESEVVVSALSESEVVESRPMLHSGSPRRAVAEKGRERGGAEPPRAWSCSSP
jgi:hypothetical protein